MDDDLGLSRDAIAGGMPMKRAKSLVYLIEQEARRQQDRMKGIDTAALSAAATGGMSNVDLQDLVDDEARRGALSADGDEAYVEAYRSARREADVPDFRWLEAAADHWASLVPDDLKMRVLVFALLTERYDIVRKRAKGFCRNLGVDDPGFAEAYEAERGQPLESAFASGGGLFGRFRR
jgi:hypothetical protein